MKRAMAAIVFVLVAVAMIPAAGCKAGGGARSGGAPATMATLAGDWTLTQVRGVDVPPASAGGRPPMLIVTPEGRVSGFAGVNRFSGALDTAELARGRFKLSPLISTKMAGPPEAMALEDKFLGALQQADGASVAGEALTLSGGGVPLLRFARSR